MKSTIKILKSAVLCAVILIGSVSLLYAKGGSKPSCVMESKFEVVVGNPWTPTAICGWVGKWGQPKQCAHGRYTIDTDYAHSVDTITSRNNPDGSCNTVNKPDSAGTIKLYLRIACPGKFDVTTYDNINFTGTGSRGACYGNISEINSHGSWDLLVQGTGTTKSPFLYSQTNHFTACIGKDWTLVAQYSPSIGLVGDCKKSTATASGFIQLISATKK
jgi:hypothetical protein